MHQSRAGVPGRVQLDVPYARLLDNLRLLGHDLFSTYGPTADTGGLFQNQAEVIYRYESIDQLLEAEAAGGQAQRHLPGSGAKSPTERPG